MDAINSPAPGPAWLEQGLEIPGNLWMQMRSQVEANLPEESCGLLAGKVNRVQAIFPLQNRLHSRTRFLLDPGEQLGAFLEIERLGMDLLAIYHSHPAGPPHPSFTDIDEAYYPDSASLIWARSGDSWQCKGFSIRDKIVREIQLVLV